MRPEKSIPVDIGIDEKSRKEIAKGISHLLADTYTLYLQTHSFHWNVTGPMFQTLHLMFETHYNELWIALDLIAERIRALGQFAPGTNTELSSLASIREKKGSIQAEEMVKTLVAGHEAVIKTARKIFPVAERASDQVTIDLLTQRMQIHEKTAWMLRSLLEK
ncbi:MAG: DNA starvation/stationary phase protection protein [Candidatus Omnitrophica bacterium]|nr:DNA starvation/stationary phase protection protein [Candidatus Omnitrophota bacterium]